MRSASCSPFCNGWRALPVRLAWLQTNFGVEIRGVAGQVMHGQFAVEPRNVFLDRERLVGRQSIEDQMQGLAASAHHPAQQLHEQRAGQRARIGGEPEGACGTDGQAALMLCRWPGTWTTGCVPGSNKRGRESFI